MYRENSLLVVHFIISSTNSSLVVLSYFFQFCNLEAPIASVIKAQSPFTCMTILHICIFLSTEILHVKTPQMLCNSFQFPNKKNHSACLLFYVQIYVIEIK